MPRRKLEYRAVPWTLNGHTVWGIKGGWKTINSTMGLYQTEAAAQAAIDAMTARRTVVIVRKVPPRRPRSA